MGELVDLLVSLAFYGTAYGMILYLLAVGLSVTLGPDAVRQPRAWRVCHGGRLPDGHRDVAARRCRSSPAVLVAVVVVGALGMLLERMLCRPLLRAPILEQVLLLDRRSSSSRSRRQVLLRAAGAADRAARLAVRPHRHRHRRVPRLPRVPDRRGQRSLAFAIWAGIERSRFGASVRAAVDNRQMAESVGINVNLRVHDLLRRSAPALAALGGSLGADLLPIYPGYPNDYLVYFLIVVAVAGMGNIARRASSSRWPSALSTR